MPSRSPVFPALFRRRPLEPVLACVKPDGARIRFHRISPGSGWTDAVLVHTETPSEFYNSRLNWKGGEWELVRADRVVFRFRACGPSARQPGQCGLIGMGDPHGQAIHVAREPGGNITRITSSSGPWISFRYDRFDRIMRAEDAVGRVTSGHLSG